MTGIALALFAISVFCNGFLAAVALAEYMNKRDAKERSKQMDEAVDIANDHLDNLYYPAPN